MSSVQQQQTITAEDLYRFRLILDPQLSPDGATIVYAVQRVNREKEKKYANLWLVNSDGGTPRQFTVGDQRDTQPRWSPDGSRIAFLSNRDDADQAQIYLIPFAGGEASRLTDLKGTIADFAWSPDGQRLLLQFRQKDADALARDEDEHKKELGIVARRITRVHFRTDGAGFLPQERWHLWTVDARSGEATQATSGDDHDETFPCWSPDGSQIAFISNRSDDPDLNPDADDVFVMPAGGGAPRRLETKIGGKFGLAFSPDGQWLSYVGSEGEGNWWRNNGLWIVPIDGSAPARNLTEQHHLHVANSTLGDIADRPFTAPIWSADGERIYFQVSRHGNTAFYAITRDGTLTEIIADGGVISNFTFDAERQRLAYLWSHFRDPGQIWTRAVADGSELQLTHVNEEWLKNLDLGALEEVWYPGSDGNELQGWILKPPGFDPASRYPSILEIHGGPWLQYGNLFMHEFFYLAAHGYVVYFTNPRGGQGYGEAHGKAIHLDWGGPDYADVMAWADHVAQEPYIDRERMGVTGGSYGGFMTLWIIGHTDRFRAAVAQRPVSNAISFWGSSDVGYLFEDPWADNKQLWEDVDAYWDQSPMKYIGNATTPTLFIHSEQDLRCNPEQSYQAFQALKILGVDTELILFPGESHGLSRGGRTDRRIARLEHILRWFETYLRG